MGSQAPAWLAGAGRSDQGTNGSPAPSLQQGKMFFFIGLTMATVQGAYARKISPGSEIAAVKRVRGSPGRVGGQALPRVPLEAAGVGPECCHAPPQAILLLVPAFLLIGWGLTLPALGLGLLLYSFGEGVLPGPGWER